MTLRIIAITCVRMGSERLPGKVMRPIAGKPHLGRLLERIKQVKNLDSIVVATSADPANDPIEALCRTEGVACFRGSEDDVLGRMVGALEAEQADIGVEVYGDGPLIDPRCIEECLEVFLEDGSYDLVGNDMKASYPSGMYSEVFSVKALKDSATKTQDPAVREHGTLFIRQHHDLYHVKNIEAQGSLHRPDIHLDIDTEDDALVIEAIVKHFAPRTDFSLQEILVFLDAHPEIAQSNQHVHRRWKQYQNKEL